MRFYPGLTPDQWTHDVPMMWARACLKMVPRLQAEESLRGAQTVGIGTGSLGKEAATKTIETLQSMAEIKPPAVVRPGRGKTAGRLANLPPGVALVRVSVKRGPHAD